MRKRRASPTWTHINGQPVSFAYRQIFITRYGEHMAQQFFWRMDRAQPTDCMAWATEAVKQGYAFHKLPENPAEKLDFHRWVRRVWDAKRKTPIPSVGDILRNIMKGEQQ